VLSLTHIFGCLWFGISSRLAEDPEYLGDTWVEYYELNDAPFEYQYFTSLHWASTQITPASMEIFPKNEPERRYNVLIVFSGLLLFSSFLSQITNAVSQLQQLGAEDHRNFAMLRRFLRDHNVRQDLAVRIRRYIEFSMSEKAKVVSQEKVVMLNWLSKGLKHELSQADVEPYFRAHPCLADLADADSWLTRAVCMRATSPESCAPEDVIFTTGLVSLGLYVVKRGNFTYGTEDGMRTLTRGDSAKQRTPPIFLAEMSLMLTESDENIQWTHRGMMRSTGFGMLVLVHRGKFLKTMLDFPECNEFFSFLRKQRLLDLASRFTMPSGIKDMIDRIAVEADGGKRSRVSLSAKSVNASLSAVRVLHKPTGRPSHHELPALSDYTYSSIDSEADDDEWSAPGKKRTFELLPNLRSSHSFHMLKKLHLA
jgi:hypothetical protein